MPPHSKSITNQALFEAENISMLNIKRTSNLHNSIHNDSDSISHNSPQNEWWRLGSFLTLTITFLSGDLKPIQLAKEGLFYDSEKEEIVCSVCEATTTIDADLTYKLREGKLHKRSCIFFDNNKTRTTLMNNLPIQHPTEQQTKTINQELHEKYCVGDVHSTSRQQPETLQQQQHQGIVQHQQETPQNQQNSRQQQETRHNQQNTREQQQQLLTLQMEATRQPQGDMLRQALVTFRQSLETSRQPLLAQNSDQGVPRSLPPYQNVATTLNSSLHHQPLRQQQHNILEVNDSPNFLLRPQPANEYSTIESRLQTFRNWPHRHPTPSQLSTAGLYSLGQTDKVKCFTCGIILRTWEPTDEPYTEHLKWSPHCAFLRTIKPANNNNMAINVPNIDAKDDKRTVSNYTGKEAMNQVLPVSTSASNLSHLSNQSNPPSRLLNNDEVESLKEENQRLKDEHLCRICLDKPANILILPCAHLPCCGTCVTALTKCPICRRPIAGTVTTFMP